MKYGAIFDVDGTLLDSMPAWSHVYVDYLTARSLPPDPAMEKKLNLMSMEQIAAYYQTRYGIDCEALVQSGEVPIFEKYDEHVPAELLRKAYAADRLRADEAEARLAEMLAEY